MSGEKAAQVEIVELFPPIDPSRIDLLAPVVEVTLLEDRAQVRRRGSASLVRGANRLVVRDVAPVMQDVSLQAELRSPEARVINARVRRATRVRSQHKPERARALEEATKKQVARFDEIADQRRRAEERQTRIIEVLERGVNELPQDAAWGVVNAQAWRDTFSALFKKSRRLTEDSIKQMFEQQDLLEELDKLAEERLLFDRPDIDLVAWLELDVLADRAGAAELSFEYVVPNAIWRPLHSARLAADRMRFSSSAAVWQNTGEDWSAVELIFSTARSSLGTEPPPLSDDLLLVQKKSNQVVVEAREVDVQRAGVPGNAQAVAPRETVELPGVDDGGEIRTLRAKGRVNVPSDGRPNLIPLFDLEAPSETELIVMPEMVQKVFLRATQVNTANAPILAGPVELIRDSGVVGWTRVLFVAPGERFELGFGPDEALRAVRKEQSANEQDPLDKWNVMVNVVHLFLSNLGPDPKKVKVLERVPVSEIDEVKVTVLADHSSSGITWDDHGFCSGTIELGPYAHHKFRLAWTMATAPGVTGI